MKTLPSQTLKVLSLAFFVVLFFISGSVCQADIYGYRDKSGVFHYTNIRPANKNYRTVAYSARRTGDAENTARTQSVPGRQKNELISMAKTYLGSPYRLGGDNHTGIDCSGFVKRVFSAFGVSLPRTAREQYFASDRIEMKELAPGDLIFFSTRKSGNPSHVGIFLGEGKFIHATVRNGGGVRIDSLADSYYRRTFAGASRPMR